jgi:hypothetical protein
VRERYSGRHRRSTSGASPVGSGGLAGATFRPLVHAGATVALAGACVGGYLMTSGEATALPSGGDARAAQVISLDRLLSPNSTAETAGLLRPPSALAAPVLGSAGLAAGASALELTESGRTARGETRLQAAAAQAQRAQQAHQAIAAAEAATRAAEADRVAREAQRAAVLASARTDPRSVARIMVAERGWNDAQFQCLNKLWTKESNWSYTARNRYSGAYGIPQSLPGSKMASAGSDWQTNPATQIAWGLSYISSVYGTPCNAWGHSVRVNWY